MGEEIYLMGYLSRYGDTLYSIYGVGEIYITNVIYLESLLQVNAAISPTLNEAYAKLKNSFPSKVQIIK